MIIVQVGLIVFLVLILIAVYQDDRRKRKLAKKSATLNGVWDKGVERRKTPRVSAEIEVHYEVVSNDANKKRSALSKDISLGGIGIGLTEKLFPGTILELQFNLPQNEKTIIAQGEIVWIKEASGNPGAEGNDKKLFNAGIKFIKVDPEDEAVLGDFINQRREHGNGV